MNTDVVKERIAVVSFTERWKVSNARPPNRPLADSATWKPKRKEGFKTVSSARFWRNRMPKKKHITANVSVCGIVVA